MHKLYILGLITLAGIIIGFAWAEQITLSTYYPAPYGVYKEMNVHYLDFKNDEYQEADPAKMPDHEEARICYDQDVEKFKYSDGNKWNLFGGGLGQAEVIDWFYVTRDSEYTKSHNLGSANLIVEIYFAPDDGTGNPDLTNISHIDRGNFFDEDSLLEITSTNITVVTDTEVGYTYDWGSGIPFLDRYNSGFYKIFLLRVD